MPGLQGGSGRAGLTYRGDSCARPRCRGLKSRLGATLAFSLPLHCSLGGLLCAELDLHAQTGRQRLQGGVGAPYLLGSERTVYVVAQSSHSGAF